MTRTQLRDFIDMKITARKRELRNEIELVVEKRLGDALSKLLGDASELERVASRFEDLLTEKIHILGSNCVPSYASITASNANKLCNAHKYFLDVIVDNAMDALLRDNYVFKCDPLVEVFKDINRELRDKIDLHNDGLKTLKEEIHTAISLESTAKRAYNALVALRVDMSDFKGVSPNLPAVVKLSVDVCAINGNCEGRD